jgi:hypothetical protein
LINKIIRLNKIIRYVFVLVVGAAAGSFGMHVLDNKKLSEQSIETTSVAGRSLVTSAAYIYSFGKDNKEATLKTIGVINNPDFSSLFNEETKTYAKEIYHKIESGEINHPDHGQ